MCVRRQTRVRLFLRSRERFSQLAGACATFYAVLCVYFLVNACSANLLDQKSNLNRQISFSKQTRPNNLRNSFLFSLGRLRLTDKRYRRKSSAIRLFSVVFIVRWAFSCYDFRVPSVFYAAPM